MAWFDWIGETIGGAFRAFSEFIGDAFEAILISAGTLFRTIGTDLSNDLVATAENPGDPLNTGAEKLYNKAVGPIEKGFSHTVAELEKGHSEITPEQAKTEVQTLWDTIRRDSGISMISALGIECASLGQIEGLYSSYQAADKISGATAFAATVAMMRYKAQWLNAYERYLNWTNPNNIPGPSDIVRFALREVYDPTRREEELRETPGLGYYQDMLENGFGQQQSDNYWASHWVLPSVGQLNDMLHRRVIDEKVWDRFVKYNDFDPTVRPWLKAISYEPYTRVDVRRMWELGLVTDEELVNTYKDLGYDDTHAQRLALWTKIYVIVPDLRARYQKGWISSEEVRNALLQEGMPADRVENYMQQIVKADKEVRTSTERDLTKAEIIKGYKNKVLDYPTALSMLTDMGYDNDEAEYILVINTEAATGSPHTFSEFQKIVNLRKKSQNLPYKEIPEDIPAMEKQIQKYEEQLLPMIDDPERREEALGIGKVLGPLKRRLKHAIEKYQGR